MGHMQHVAPRINARAYYDARCHNHTWFCTSDNKMLHGALFFVLFFVV